VKKLLNTLYVTTQGAYLCQEGESVLVRIERETKLRVPIHMLGGIVCFGQVSCSPPLMGLCGERDVGISFLSENGRFLARIQGPVSGNVLLRRRQYRLADSPPETLQIARAFVAGKIANCRTVLQRALRDHACADGRDGMEGVVRRMGRQLQELEQVGSVDELRGMEGEAANRYFDVFDHLIASQKNTFHFTGRNRRPPMDNVNALLSFVYTLLTHDASSALESVGLDPQVGYLHAERPGRPSLALDLIEEFRAFIGDRLALSLINLKQLQANDFKTTESGAVSMSDDARKTLLAAYQKRKQEEIVHPFLGEKVQVGLLLHLQALLLARHIRGDLDGYPSFIWK
jgi:CRISPR-associated protein Cas1